MSTGGNSTNYFCRLLSVFVSFLLVLSLPDYHCLQFKTIGVLVEASELTSLSPRVVFTKQGPVQGFLGPGNVGAHYQPQTDGSYTFRHYSGRPVVEVSDISFCSTLYRLHWPLQHFT